MVATASADSSANIYNINTGMTLQKLRGHQKSVNKVAYALNSKHGHGSSEAEGGSP